jgi:hypothetical protein
METPALSHSVRRLAIPLLLSVFLAPCLLASRASALATYHYTGNDFSTQSYDSSSTGGTNTIRTRVTGSFTVATPLPADLPYSNIGSSVLSLSFSDGLSIIDDISHTSVLAFNVRTDANGGIIEWAVILDVLPDDETGAHVYIDTMNAAHVYPIIRNWPPQAVDLVAGQSYTGALWDNPGTWTMTLAPEPSTALLLAAGLMTLGMQRRRNSDSRGDPSVRRRSRGNAPPRPVTATPSPSW